LTPETTLKKNIMKKCNLLNLMGMLVVLASFAFVSCTKEGPMGAAGKDGVDGEDGINGTDGTATCGACHDNSETVEIKIAQWEQSIHAMGGHNFENATGCAPCHTSQGFKEVVNTDSTNTEAAIENPANINCYTCHKIHDSYSASDWELRKTTPMKFWLTDETVDLGKANLCVACHQPRISYQIPDVSAPNADYTFSSKRFGPHHGSQGAILTGSAMFNVGTGYSNSSHYTLNTDGCVTCHMASPIGSIVGGHSFNVYNEEEGFNFAGCVSCHPGEGEAEGLVEDLQPEIEGLMTQLGVLLATAGIYDSTSTSGYAVPGTYANKIAGAYWNWISIEEDRSLGVHNPKFVKKILENSIESLQ
jgi:hypothetical protein